MENTQDSVQLTSAELSNLWTIYLSDSMSICVFAHFLEHIEDKEIKSVISYAKQLSEEHIAYIRTLYEKEAISIPEGFTESDVNLKAKRLFTDIFYVRFLKQMANAGLTAYANMIQSVFRQDILDFFIA